MEEGGNNSTEEIIGINREIVHLLLMLIRAGVPVGEVEPFFYPIEGIEGHVGKPARLEGLRFLAQQKGLLGASNSSDSAR